MQHIIVAIVWAVSLGLLSLSLQQCHSQPTKKPIPDGANLLIHERSPYLLQHAYNPVRWHPWGETARKKAQEENKLMIISIGYAACHWCHVMEEESFEDEEVAKVMNTHYISVKVDREERPDVDQIYMDACMLLNRRGGWPLNVVSLPNGKPIFAGTYFTKPQWIRLLQQIQTYYEQSPEKIVEQADKISQGIREMSIQLPVQAQKTTETLPARYERLAKQLLAQADTLHGGIQGAPKFPMPAALLLLLQVQKTNKEVRDFLQITLHKMAAGGLYDQLGGGFARYAVDETWTVPHFEKMLYDNAQLLSVYSQAYKVFGLPRYEQVVRQSADFMTQELMEKGGGFYSSLDADSEGKEGLYYLWKKEEITTLLTKEEATIFNEYYGVRSGGNFEGHTILTAPHPIEEVATKLGYAIEVAEKHLQSAEKTLKQVREKRIKPGLDDKIITAWNALAMVGYCDAYESFGEKKYLKNALEIGTFIREKQWSHEGGLHRIHKDGTASITGFLDDYAFAIFGYIRLYECTFEEHWLTMAHVLKGYVLANFLDRKSQFFFYTPHNAASDLIARKIVVDGGVIPAANAVLARALWLLGIYYGEEKDIDHANYMVERMKKNYMDAPYFYSAWASTHLMQSAPNIQVAIVGKDALAHKEALSQYPTGPISYVGCQTEVACSLPLLKNKWQEGKTLYYVCKDKSCRLPVSTAKEALTQINDYQVR